VTVGFAVALSVVILALVCMIAFGLVMYRHTKILARSVAEFQEAVQPIMEDIQREANEASEHAARLSEGLPRGEPGAKMPR
jgi:uncharacterized membrane-anchored protein YhcB (DUF1043 family)